MSLQKRKGDVGMDPSNKKTRKSCKKTCNEPLNDDIKSIDDVMNTDKILRRTGKRLDSMDRDPERRSTRIAEINQEKNLPSYVRPIEFNTDSSLSNEIGTIIFPNEQYTICNIQEFTLQYPDNSSSIVLNKKKMFLKSAEILDLLSNFRENLYINPNTNFHECKLFYDETNDEVKKKINNILVFCDKGDKSIKMYFKSSDDLAPLAPISTYENAPTPPEQSTTGESTNILLNIKFNDTEITNVETKIIENELELELDENDVKKKIDSLLVKSSLTSNDMIFIKAYLARMDLLSSFEILNIECSETDNSYQSTGQALSLPVNMKYDNYFNLYNKLNDVSTSGTGGKSKIFARNSHASSKPKLGKCPRRVLRLVYQR